MSIFSGRYSISSTATPSMASASPSSLVSRGTSSSKRRRLIINPPSADQLPHLINSIPELAEVEGLAERQIENETRAGGTPKGPRSHLMVINAYQSLMLSPNVTIENILPETPPHHRAYSRNPVTPSSSKLVTPTKTSSSILNHQNENLDPISTSPNRHRIQQPRRIPVLAQDKNNEIPPLANAHYLSNWFPKIVKNRLVVEGDLDEDDDDDQPEFRRWTSSGIKSMINSRVLMTKKSPYVLQGKLDTILASEEGIPEFIIKSFSNGFPLDWKNCFEKWKLYINNPAEYRKSLTSVNNDSSMQDSSLKMSSTRINKINSKNPMADFSSEELSSSKNSKIPPPQELTPVKDSRRRISGENSPFKKPETPILKKNSLLSTLKRIKRSSSSMTNQESSPNKSSQLSSMLRNPNNSSINNITSTPPKNNSTVSNQITSNKNPLRTQIETQEITMNSKEIHQLNQERICISRSYEKENNSNYTPKRSFRNRNSEYQQDKTDESDVEKSPPKQIRLSLQNIFKTNSPQKKITPPPPRNHHQKFHRRNNRPENLKSRSFNQDHNSAKKSNATFSIKKSTLPIEKSSEDDDDDYNSESPNKINKQNDSRNKNNKRGIKPKIIQVLPRSKRSSYPVTETEEEEEVFHHSKSPSNHGKSTRKRLPVQPYQSENTPKASHHIEELEGNQEASEHPTIGTHKFPPKVKQQLINKKNKSFINKKKIEASYEPRILRSRNNTNHHGTLNLVENSKKHIDDENDSLLMEPFELGWIRDVTVKSINRESGRIFGPVDYLCPIDNKKHKLTSLTKFLRSKDNKQGLKLENFSFDPNIFIGNYYIIEELQINNTRSKIQRIISIDDLKSILYSNSIGEFNKWTPVDMMSKNKSLLTHRKSDNKINSKDDPRSNQKFSKSNKINSKKSFDKKLTTEPEPEKVLDKKDSRNEEIEVEGYVPKPKTIKQMKMNAEILQKINSNHQDDYFTYGKNVEIAKCPDLALNEVFLSDDDDDDEFSIHTPRTPLVALKPRRGSSSNCKTPSLNMTEDSSFPLNEYKEQHNAFIQRKTKERNKIRKLFSTKQSSPALFNCSVNHDPPSVGIRRSKLTEAKAKELVKPLSKLLKSLPSRNNDVDHDDDEDDDDAYYYEEED